MTFQGSGPGGGAATLQEVVALVRDVVPGIDGVNVTESKGIGEIEVKLYGANEADARIVREALSAHLSGHLRALVVYDPVLEGAPRTTTLAFTCPDCKGSGQYVGLWEARACPTCGGSGNV